jgi:RimJ/RimL family protein N-acetyltransferase
VRLKLITCKEATSLLDSELMGRVSENGDGGLCPDYTYLGIYADEKIIGFWAIHYTSSTTLHIHINIVEDFRCYASAAGWFFLGYIYEEYPEIMRIECEVPLCYQDVIKFILKFNFKAEGVKRKAVYRNGVLQDVQMLSLLRSEYNGRS